MASKASRERDRARRLASSLWRYAKPGTIKSIRAYVKRKVACAAATEGASSTRARGKIDSMWTMLILALALVSGACAIPQASQAPPPPRFVVKLRLIEPMGGTGDLTFHVSAGILARSEGAGEISVEHDRLRWAFRPAQVAYNAQGLGIRLHNQTAHAITIRWDEASLTGPDRVARRVIHQGIRLIDRAAPMAPTTVPPSAVSHKFDPTNSTPPYRHKG